MIDLKTTIDIGGHCRWDVIVIGAGPAGAMAARELAVRGARTLLVERREFPREKVCGGCLNGQALAVLRTAGLAQAAERAGGMPLHSIRLGVPGRSVRLDMPAGMAVSRDRFDAQLVAAAVEAGAEFQPGTEAQVGPVDGESRLVLLGRAGHSRSVATRLVLVATGLGRLRLPDGFAPRTRIARGSRIGAGCIVEGGPSEYMAGTIHMAVGREGYVGLVRLSDGRLHLAIAMRPGAVQDAGGPGIAAAAVLAATGFATVPGLGTAAWRGTPGLTRRTRPLADERLFVLGDAAGYVEPFTGEGIAWALASARAIGPLAASAVERWSPRLGRDWEILHGRVVGRRQVLCRAAAAVLRRPRLARAALEIVARLPSPARLVLDRLNAPPLSVEAS